MSEITIHHIQESFDKVVATMNGKVTNTFVEGRKLYLWSRLPLTRELWLRDRVQQGVALEATVQGVWIRPHIFRKICTSGLIQPSPYYARYLEPNHLATEAELAGAIQTAVQGCIDAQVFALLVKALRLTRLITIDWDQAQAQLKTSIPPVLWTQIKQKVALRFHQRLDSTRFGLINSITTAARDASDPNLRWQLEMLAGGLLFGELVWGDLVNSRVSRSVPVQAPQFTLA